MNRRIKLAAMATLFGLLLLLAVTVELASREPRSAGYSWPHPVPAASPGQAAGQLNALVVAPMGDTGDYRDAAFPLWSQAVSGQPCTVQEAALLRAGSNTTTDKSCRVTGGQWATFGDGEIHTRPAEVTVEHLVPLLNAWRSGASTWTDAMRADFANDLDSPALIVLSANSAETRGDSGPERWRPAQESAWCQYAADWVVVKASYHLTVTADEKAALVDMLRPCQE